MSKTGEKVFNRSERIFFTLLIAVFTPLGMLPWRGVFLLTSDWFRDLEDWAPPWLLPEWLTAIVFLLVAILWFALPWVGIVWLLLKIWRNSRWKPRITQDKGCN